MADMEPVMVLLDRYSILISAYVHIAPGDLLDLPWWQIEQAIEIAELRLQREGVHRG